jgi:hypothetical protein
MKRPPSADLRHPSLRAKKFDESQNLWQSRVNRDWRFYFVIIGDTCVITNVIPHPRIDAISMADRSPNLSKPRRLEPAHPGITGTATRLLCHSDLPQSTHPKSCLRRYTKAVYCVESTTLLRRKSLFFNKRVELS